MFANLENFVFKKNQNQKVCQTFYSMFIHVHDGVQTHSGLDLASAAASSGRR
jgi:hypothetical protein